MLRTNDAGTPGSTAAISRRTALAAASGAPSVCTTQYMLFASQMVVGSGTCADRHVGLDRGLLFEAEMPHIADDAYDLHLARHFLSVVEAHAAADRIVALEVTPGEGVVDDRDRRRITRSAESNARPLRSGMPSVRKYSGLIIL